MIILVITAFIGEGDKSHRIAAQAKTRHWGTAGSGTTGDGPEANWAA